jgi:hypothetical protein
MLHDVLGLDSSMNDKSCRDSFNEIYVNRQLDVLERPYKKILEHPGAFDLLKRYPCVRRGHTLLDHFDKKRNILG